MPRRLDFSVLFVSFVIITFLPQCLAQEPARGTQTRQPDKLAATSMEELVYERAQATLSRYIEALTGREGKVTKALGGTPPKEVDESFREMGEGLQKEVKELEDGYKRTLRENDRECVSCPESYHAAIGWAIGAQEGLLNDPRWIDAAVAVLRRQYASSEDQLGDEFSKKRDELDNNANRSPEQRDADRAKLEAALSDRKKKTFDLLAREFRDLAAVLTEERNRKVDELWCWYDFANLLAKSTKDEDGVHAEAAKLAKETLQHYGDTLGNIVGDLILSYGDYEWCKAMPYPDIQGP